MIGRGLICQVQFHYFLELGYRICLRYSIKGGLEHSMVAAESSTLPSGVKTNFSGTPFEAPKTTVSSEWLFAFERNITG